MFAERTGCFFAPGRHFAQPLAEAQPLVIIALLRSSGFLYRAYCTT